MIERVRTELERAFPLQGTPVTVEALGPSTARPLTMIQAMTDVIIVAGLIIAACSLAVNVVGGLTERRRPFSLLRLTGVPRKLLHRIVTLESALPLLLVAAVSIVVGPTGGRPLPALAGRARLQPSGILLLDHGDRRAGRGRWQSSPRTFPILDRITGPEVARNE